MLCCFALTANAQAPDSIPKVRKARTMAVEYFYIHGALGWGFDVYQSSDIEKLFQEKLKVNSVGFPFQYGFRGGFRNIAQIEYSKYTTSAHNIGTGGFVGGEIVGMSVPMKLKATDILFKVNPFFWGWTKPTNGRPAKCLFLIVGTSDLTYRDKINEGFDGSGMIYGLEWAGISKYVSFSFGATYQNITYDKARLFGRNFTADMKATRFLMYGTLGFGYGM
jgi:hypothetical protein